MALTSFLDARQGPTGGLSRVKRANSATFLGTDSLLGDRVPLILTIERSNRTIGGGLCDGDGVFSSFITEVGINTAGLGRWTWVRVGGGGKSTRIITAYQPCDPKKKTMGETVWDQHTQYFKARGDIRNPRVMFKADLLNLLCAWLVTGGEVLLFGDFNEDVYSGPLAGDLARDEFRMTDLCLCTTLVCLPFTHTHRRTPINAVFATSGLVCMAVTLLPSLVGVGDHRVFILGIDSRSLLGDVFPRVILVS
jgi:hypothetical protein